MNHARALSIALLVLLFTLAGTLSVQAGQASLAALPLGEQWFGIYLGGERTGFARHTLAETDDGYEITVEASVKMLVLGFSREASSRERYRVSRSLSLRSFQVEQVLDGTPMMLSGEATPKGVKVTVISGGSRKEKLLKAKGSVYPPPALNLYPLLKGTAPGKVYRLQMIDIEGVKVKEVEITVKGSETLPDGTRALHIRNDLYPMVDNDVWLDPSGRTIRESVRDGLVETRAEDRESTRRFIAEAALSRRDLILDFSLVRVEPPLKDPTALTRLVLEVEGIPAGFTLPQGGGQEARRRDDGKVVFTVEPTAKGSTSGEDGEPARFLAPTDRLPADHPTLVARAKEVVGEEPDAGKRVEKLVRWVAGYVEDSVTDAPSPLDTLASRKGNCQSHARLYVSVARAAGIPSRFVSGLVYLAGKGFLYHSWAESRVEGGWLPVDPTFGQVPVDATHVKLVEGESPDEMAAIAGVVGKIRARVMEVK